MRIGILHPGDMGSSLGAALVAAGQSVSWVREGRSEDSCRRAAADGLAPVANLPQLVRETDVLISICPPHAALELARSVAAADFTGCYVDANAVAPATAREIDAILGADIDMVDGGVIGPPARQPDTTRLYLTGARAGEIAALFNGSLLQTIVIEGGVGAASALKMGYAAWTKGSAALLLAVGAMARHEGVAQALLEEWQLSQQDLPAMLRSSARSSAPKAWRFSGEMQEVATTFRQAGMPDGFHLAASETYQRLASLKNHTSVDLEEVLEVLAPR